MRLTLIIYAFLIVLVPMLGQSSGDLSKNSSLVESKVEIKKDNYDNLKSKLKVRKTKKVLRLKDSEPSKTNKSIDHPDVNIGEAFSLIKYLMYLIIGALVLFVVYLLLGSINVDKPDLKAKVFEQEVIENIEDVDTFEGCQFFIESANYRGAFRMLFIRVLQNLQETKSISWKKEKTNRDYSYEMSTHPYSTQFLELTKMFDYIWYGDKSFESDQYYKSLVLFEKFLNDIPTKSIES